MDRACENCRFCIYAHSRGKEEQYCERHRKFIGDTLLCSEWEMVSVPKPQTIYDRIVSKTPEELAEWLYAVSKSWYDEGYTKDNESPLMSGYPATANEWIAWLKSQVEVDE